MKKKTWWTVTNYGNFVRQFPSKREAQGYAKRLRDANKQAHGDSGMVRVLKSTDNPARRKRATSKRRKSNPSTRTVKLKNFTGVIQRTADGVVHVLGLSKK